ncbi:hypothetical protein ACIPIN_19770 [Pseudomonas sp. NPDC087697]|uniref:hypothetical protein n=1 Tax=Pseudomonas sp. NPDC087697 TaxID=3364447 RepID=UPI0037F8EB23
MQAQHPSSSEMKATTAPQQAARSVFKPSRRMLATAVVGAALIGYQIHKTPDALVHLRSVAGLAQATGDLTEQDAAVVAELLADRQHLNGARA